MFEYRRKDVMATIRADCVTYLGEWIRIYPVLYCKNNCLAILGWALSDRQPEVRMAAVAALTQIYSEDDMISQIDMFTEHFKGM